MTYGKIQEIAESYINGNISGTKSMVKRMSKHDLLEFINNLAQYYGVTYHEQGKPYFDYQSAINAVERLLQ